MGRGGGCAGCVEGLRGCGPLAAARLAQRLFDGQQAAQVDELQQAEFEVEALLLAVAQLVEGAQHDLQEARQLLFAEERGGAGGAALLVGGDLQQLVADAVGGAFGREPGDLGDQRVAQIADALAGELRGRVAGVEQLVGHRHHFGGAVAVDGLHHPLEDGVGDGAHQLANLGGIQPGMAVLRLGRAGDGLVHDGERVAHGAVAGLGQQGERGLIGGDALRRRQSRAAGRGCRPA